ncbi:MAG: homoserine kinase [Ignavibacteriae bacterium]|nr:MAG: homoserine kinase [Ignavibacteriota bacterium]
MAAKINYLKKDFIKILSNYKLGEFVSSKPFAAGKVQTNILLQTTKGKFVFKFYENRSIKSVLFECNLIKYLKAKNYPCPGPFKNKQGKLVGTFIEKPFVVFEFIEGRHIKNPNENQKRELIKRAAELHNITASYKPQYKNYRWNYSVELCKELAGKKAQKLNTKNARRKLMWLEDELSKLKLPKSLPKGVCHCDFHFSNVLFVNNKFNALIDFDDANYTFLIFDLAGLINPFNKSFEWDTWEKFKKDGNIFDFKEARIIVSEYMKCRTLSITEKKHLFDVFKLGILFDSVWYFLRGNVDDFYEKRKVAYLNTLGRSKFYNALFEVNT